MLDTNITYPYFSVEKELDDHTNWRETKQKPKNELCSITHTHTNKLLIEVRATDIS